MKVKLVFAPLQKVETLTDLTRIFWNSMDKIHKIFKKNPVKTFCPEKKLLKKKEET